MKMNKVNGFLLLASLIIVSATVHAQEMSMSALDHGAAQMNMDKNMVMDKGSMANGMGNMKNMHPQGNMDPATKHKQMGNQDHQPMKPELNSSEDNKH